MNTLETATADDFDNQTLARMFIDFMADVWDFKFGDGIYDKYKNARKTALSQNAKSAGHSKDSRWYYYKFYDNSTIRVLADGSVIELTNRID